MRRLVYRLAYQGLRVWWLVRRPEVSGVKCVLTRGDRVLLVRHTYGPRVWDLPGGTMKPDEDPMKTAGREIQEELGLVIDDWTRLGEISNTLDHRRDRLYVFAAETGADQLTIDRGEVATAKWFARTELPLRLGYYVRQILDRAERVG